MLAGLLQEAIIVEQLGLFLSMISQGIVTDSSVRIIPFISTPCFCKLSSFIALILLAGLRCDKSFVRTEYLHATDLICTFMQCLM